MPDIGEEELGLMQRATSLLGRLNGNPEARRHLERSLKAVDPTIKTSDEQLDEVLAPRLEGVKALETRLTERLAELDADKAARVEQTETQQYDAAFGRLRQRDGLTEDGEREVLKLMVERKIADPEAAFALFQRLNPAPALDSSPSYIPQKWDFQENAVEQDTQLLWDNPGKWADKMIPAVLADERREPARV